LDREGRRCVPGGVDGAVGRGHRDAEAARVHMGERRDVVGHPALAEARRERRVDLVEDGLQVGRWLGHGRLASEGAARG